jgi:protoheme IX farnesyltransferase
MVLATRFVPGVQLGHWAWLTVWTLVGGTLAAGSANAINCYLDRDIDELMTRTRRRPLPAHQVDPQRAVVFGLALGAISFAILAFFVNLVAAFLGLLAIAFYVVVYTIILKRSTPQNIVIGGAAGALPPVIGWAAVTGNVGVPALVLFALVFYWTPPHFWALSLRIRKDYAAAGVPMLPVVRGNPRDDSPDRSVHDPHGRDHPSSSSRVARMGPIYLVAAVVLGTMFLRQAYGCGGAARPRRLDRRRDPALQVLDLVPDAAVRRDRGRRDRRAADLAAGRAPRQPLDPVAAPLGALQRRREETTSLGRSGRP